MDQKDLRNTTKKERIAVAVLLAAILLLYAFFLKDILIPFLKLEARHDLHGANELLLSKGQRLCSGCLRPYNSGRPEPCSLR